MESSDFKLALQLGTDLFSLNGMDFQRVVTKNKVGYCFITVEIGP